MVRKQDVNDRKKKCKLPALKICQQFALSGMFYSIVFRQSA